MKEALNPRKNPKGTGKVGSGAEPVELAKANERILIYLDGGIVEFVHEDGSVGRCVIAAEDMEKHNVPEALVEMFEKEGFKIARKQKQP